MSRKRIALVSAITLLALSLVGVAYAAFNGRLTGSGNIQSIKLMWDETVPGTPGSSDSGTQNDPSTFGQTPTREAYHLAQTTASFSGGGISANITGAYEGYVATLTGMAKATGQGTANLVVQSVSDNRTDLDSYLDPAICGTPVTGAGTWISVGLKVPVGGTVDGSLTFDVKVVPQSAYVAGNCNGWPTS